MPVRSKKPPNSMAAMCSKRTSRQRKPTKEMVHDRYKDLASVEQAFRSCKTVPLEVRPIFLRLAERTRAHAFVVRLAYQIIQYLALCWSPLDVTVEEGLHALTTLCL